VSLLDRIVASEPRAALLVRLTVGAVFLLEGLQKFIELWVGEGPSSLDRRIARPPAP